MFNQEVLHKNKEMQKNWEEKLSQIYKKFEFKRTTDSGIPVKPVYTAQDIDSLDFQEIGLPGEYPYTRGVYPLQYQYMPLMAQQGFGYGLPEHTRERYEFLRSQGMEGYRGMEAPYLISPDIPGLCGMDPDDPEARGFVGWAGTSISTLKDMEILYSELPLEKIHISYFGMYEFSIVLLAMLCAYLEKRFPLEKMSGNITNCFTTQNLSNDQPKFSGESSLKLAVELIKFCSRHMPKWGTLNLQGYGTEEAGGTSVQELAYNIAIAIEVARACVKAGLDLDTVVPRFSMQASCGRDFFEHIAKLRAARRMWAKIFKEKFNCQNPRSYQLRIHVQTSGASMTKEQPLNNLIRASLFTLAAILGGVQSVWTTCYDEALSLPCEEAQMLAMRTRQIIMEESNIPNVCDPLGGSYYIEWLTAKLEEEAFKLVDEIERRGGYVKCWGMLKNEVDKVYREWKKKVESGEKVIVGTNKYVVPEKEWPVKFQVDPRWEEIAVERVKNFKAKRDNRKTQRALEELRVVANRVNNEWPWGGDLMPVLIEAAKADATLGEMARVLKETFGYQFSY